MSSEEATECGLVEALEILTEDGPPQVAAALKADGPRMLAERRRLDRGFEKRLRQRWGSALDLYYMVAVACQEVGAEGYQEANQCDEGGDDERALLEAVSGLQARACRQSLEVLSLLEAGFPKAAHAVSRSMHEGAVVASVLTALREAADVGVNLLELDALDPVRGEDRDSPALQICCHVSLPSFRRTYPA